jgi:hypothetical protein
MTAAVIALFGAEARPVAIGASEASGLEFLTAALADVDRHDALRTEDTINPVDLPVKRNR